MEIDEGISPKGYAAAGSLSPKDPRLPRSVAGCCCFACKKQADFDVGGWWATEFEARMKCKATKAEMSMKGWFCGNCHWAAREKANYRHLWSTAESRKMEIDWLAEALLKTTCDDWAVLFLWVEQV